MEQLTKFGATLGRPFYEDSDCLLYQHDCLDGLDLLKDEHIDLTITSPPYNIGKEYESPLSLRDYLDWSEAWIKRVHTVTRRSGAFWLNLGYVKVPGRAKALPLPYLLWDRIPFFLIQEVVWNYGAGVAAKRSLSPRNEKFLWYVKSDSEYAFNLDEIRDPNVKYPRQFKNGKLKVNPLGKNPSDVWYVPKVTSGRNRASPERTPHPAQFPIALVDRIVKGCSNPDDVILDPFMGSGTTALAALRNGRRVIGFETRQDYCEIAVARILEWRSRGKQPELLLVGE